MNIRARRVTIVKATWIKIADEPLVCERFVGGRGFLARDSVVNTQAAINPPRVQIRKQNHIRVVIVTPAIVLEKKWDDKERKENTECLDVVLVVSIVSSDVVEVLAFGRESPVEELALGGDVFDELARSTLDLSAGCCPFCASASAALRPSPESGASSGLSFRERAASSEYPISPTSLGVLIGRGPACGRCSIPVCPIESPPAMTWEVEAEEESESEAVHAMVKGGGTPSRRRRVESVVIQPPDLGYVVAVGPRITKFRLTPLGQLWRSCLVSAVPALPWLLS